MCPRFPTALPLPLVSLRLASDNLLDSAITDARGVPAFVLETEGNITTLSRCDPASASACGPTQLSASVEWPLAQPVSPKPKAKEPVATVCIDGRTEPSDLLLKKSIMGNSRKFQLPGSPGTLRWKRVADHYQCTLCTLACTCHNAVASLYPPTATAPGELSVFIPALSADLRQSPHQHSDVSVRLLEYLIITSVLLTTAHDDWRRFPNAPDFSSPPPPLSSARSLRQRLSPPSSPTPSPTISVSTTFASPASPTRRKLDLLEGEGEGNSDPFYSSSPTSTHCTHYTHYTTRSLSRSRSSNYLRPTPFSTPPSTPPIAYHDLPTIALPARALPPTPTSPTSPPPSVQHVAPVPVPAPQYTAHPLARSQSLQGQPRARDAPPVPPIPQHFLAPPAPDEAPPSYAEIEWTVKVPQRRVSRREQTQQTQTQTQQQQQQAQGYLLQ